MNLFISNFVVDRFFIGKVSYWFFELFTERNGIILFLPLHEVCYEYIKEHSPEGFVLTKPFEEAFDCSNRKLKGSIWWFLFIL